MLLTLAGVPSVGDDAPGKGYRYSGLALQHCLEIYFRCRLLPQFRTAFAVKYYLAKRPFLERCYF